MLNSAAISTQSIRWQQILRWGSPRRIDSRSSEQDGQVQQLHLAFQRAYRHFATLHPIWVQRRFDDDFLRRAIPPRRVRRYQQAALTPLILPTATALAVDWDREFGLLSPTEAIRSQRLAELMTVAHRFLTLYTNELAKSATTPA